jgi:hypothetical protein
LGGRHGNSETIECESRQERRKPLSRCVRVDGRVFKDDEKRAVREVRRLHLACAQKDRHNASGHSELASIGSAEERLNACPRQCQPADGELPERRGSTAAGFNSPDGPDT